jgi:hypothetical protein
MRKKESFFMVSQGKAQQEYSKPLCFLSPTPWKKN